MIPKLLHITPGLDPAKGGPSVSVRRTVESMAQRRECETELLFLETGRYYYNDPGVPLSADVKVHKIKSKAPLWSSLPSITAVNLLVSRFDIVHTHGLWHSYSNVPAALAVAKGKASIVSPHGMLGKEALNLRPIRKRIALSLWEGWKLNLGCVRALTALEAKDIRDEGIKAPVVVIPNGVDTFYRLQRDEALDVLGLQDLSDRRFVIFMSRINEGKGIYDLLEAWRQAVPWREAGYTLLVAGPVEPCEKDRFVEAIGHLDADASFKYVGMVSGRRKAAILSLAHLFVLPSYFEGMSMALLEALSAGIPILCTRSCHFSEIETRGAGLATIECGPEAVSQGLTDLLSQSDSCMSLMSRNGASLAREKYTWDSTVDGLFRVNKWLLGQSGVPADYIFD